MMEINLKKELVENDIPIDSLEEFMEDVDYIEDILLEIFDEHLIKELHFSEDDLDSFDIQFTLNGEYDPKNMRAIFDIDYNFEKIILDKDGYENFEKLISCNEPIKFDSFSVNVIINQLEDNLILFFEKMKKILTANVADWKSF